MKSKLISLILIIFLILLPFLLPSNESRFQKWSQSILCPVCQGETIFDSPSEYADDMRLILEDQINNNLSDEEIYNFWVSRYGEKIITNPFEKSIEIVAIPVFIVILFIFVFIRKLNVKK